MNEGGIDMTINCFKTVSAKGLIYLPVALRRFVGIHEDDVRTGKKFGGKAVFAKQKY